jgi:hypothetical protein
MSKPESCAFAPVSAMEPLDLAAFDRAGIVHVPGFVPPAMVDMLREDFERMMLALPYDGASICQDKDDRERRVMRVNNVVHPSRLPALSVLLGSPPFRRLLLDLCGADGIVTQTDLLIRRQTESAPINWHQDAVIEPGHRWVALGVALDDTVPGDGDLLGVAGSHQGAQDIVALEDAYGWSPPSLVRAAPRAGDLVMHHVMLVHGSMPPVGLTQRRTLYIYVDSAARIRAAEPTNTDWAAGRFDLMRCAERVWQA